MLSSVTAANIILSDDGGEAVPHGGDLVAARRLFPGAPEPFVDLSTGINPWPYPLPRLSRELYARLPEAADLSALAAAAVHAYGVPSVRHVVPGPGSQILLPLVASLATPTRAAVLEPTYEELRRAAILAGHQVVSVGELASCGDAGLVMLANPNNPDGRLLQKNALLDLADELATRGGLLVIDEAFMDVGPPDASLASELHRGNIVVLRSFGKFFGLAGVRLGFALAAPALAARLAALLGPWPVSGPALAVGSSGLADTAWTDGTRLRLAKAAARLDGLLARAGLDLLGGTSLFRLVQESNGDAGPLFRRLGRSGILVRGFPGHPAWLRFGLPGDAHAWRRLAEALPPRR